MAHGFLDTHPLVSGRLRSAVSATAACAMIALAALLPGGRSKAYEVYGGSWSSIAPVYVCNSATYPGHSGAWASALSGWYNTSTPFYYSSTCSGNTIGLLDVSYSGVSWDGAVTHSPNRTSTYSAAWGYLNYYYTEDYYEQGWSYAVIGLASHELGHILGLAHEDDLCAIMNAATADRFLYCTIWGPQADDVNGINFIY
jgi:predicted Zn-dependent protease